MLTGELAKPVSPEASDGLSQRLMTRVHWLRGYIHDRIPQRMLPIVSADDILQDVWIAAHRNIDKSGPVPHAALDKWLVKIAQTKLIDAVRTAKAQKRGGDCRFLCAAEARLSSLCGIFSKLGSRPRTPSHEAGRIEAAHAVNISLAALPEERRQAIELRYIQGLLPDEIARRIGKTESAVKSLIYNGLRQLRDMLGEVSHYLSS